MRKWQETGTPSKTLLTTEEKQEGNQRAEVLTRSHEMVKQRLAAESSL